MADVSVNGWIAEGGHTIIEGKKNNIILFDVVENCGHVGGLSDDKYKNNNAWFHCCFEINIEDPSKASFIPTGYTLQRIQSNGWAWGHKEDNEYDSLPMDTYLYGEQIADYIREGEPVHVKGRELLLNGIDSKILRMIDVTELWFDPRFVREKPKLLTVPYKCGLYITKDYPTAKEGET